MPFRINISGQVKEIRLPQYKALWPLFETIVNSIQSIEDSDNKDSGEIIIYAERLEDKSQKITGDEQQSVFSGFTVIDNGMGFNNENYNSFLEAYSDYKITKGCKGIGRLLWLKAFENVSIDSTYFENNEWKRRKFNFNLNNIIDPENNLTIPVENKPSTIVKLERFEMSYRAKAPIGLRILARRIIEHCLPYLLSPKCPNMILKDSDGDSINLNEYYENTINDSLHQDEIIIDDYSFRLYHILMHDGIDKHELHFCANNREVKSYDLSKRIPDLQKKIVSDDKSYYYVGYLTGSYLDERVNSNRTEFAFDEKTMIDSFGMEQLEEIVFKRIKTYLADDLLKIKEEKELKIKEFVNTKKPQYRYLLNNCPEIINDIPSGLNDDKLDIELYKLTQKWEYMIKKQGKEIEEHIKNGINTTTDYMTMFNSYCKGITEISRASLSEYVIRRKVILDLLEKSLSQDENGSYFSESTIHSIICPMRVSSDEISFDEMNLWIIDDRLAYHDYLASDKKIKSLPTLESDSDKRMDIAIFDTAFSFTSDETPINSITIIELKKPQRNDLNADDKNPINQVLNYVSEIRKGKVKRANGMDFGPVNHTSFYCYVIADMTDTLISDAENAGLIKTPDGLGYYGYNNAKNAYIEVISYTKLLKDAKQRNSILFEKLFSPNNNQVLKRS